MDDGSSLAPDFQNLFWTSDHSLISIKQPPIWAVFFISPLQTIYYQQNFYQKSRMPAKLTRRASFEVALFGYFAFSG